MSDLIGCNLRFNKNNQKALILVVNKTLLFIAIFCFYLPLTVSAQEKDSLAIPERAKKNLAIPDSIMVKSKPTPKPKKKNFLFAGDSLAVYHFSADFPEAFEKFSDTIIDPNFYQFDPTRNRNDQQVHLGHLGSATEDLVFGLKPKMGTMIGFDHYDTYLKKAEDVKFYKAQRSFTDLFYSQGNEQNDHIFKGSIGRKFDNGFQISVEHQRVIHSLDDPDLALNTNAFYPYQSTKNTFLLIGLAYEPEDKKYSSYLGFAHNEIQAINHGGIVQNDPSIFSIIEAANNLDDSYTVPVLLNTTEAKTRFALRELKYNQYYDFIKSDSEEKVNRNFRIGHSIAYAYDNFKFSDVNPDSSYYQNFFDDERGIRLFLKTEALENYVSLSSAVNDKEKQKSKYELGLRHVYNKIEQEFSDSTVQNLFAEGILKTKIFDIIELTADGQIGLLQNIGDYRLNANLGLDLKKFGKLSATLIQQRYAPELIYQSLVLSQSEFWSNDFQKPFESELRFSYDLSSFKLQAHLSYFLLDNYLYFDEDRLPNQLESPLNLVQLKIKKDVTFGLLRMENTIVLQQSTNDEILRLPRWSTIHSIGIQGKLFKKVLLTRLGLDFRFNDSYFANEFFPLLNQFHIQNSRSVDFYPAIDAHLVFKVQTFRFFFKMDNLTAFITDETFYQIPYYPQKEAAFRFGIAWQFYDQHSSKKSTNRTDSNNNTGGGRNNF